MNRNLIKKTYILLVKRSNKPMEEEILNKMSQIKSLQEE
jgi:hypothetical protein